MTKAAFENAITIVIALGGSTNAVLHLLAIAREAGLAVAFDLPDSFDDLAERFNSKLSDVFIKLSD